MDRNKENIKRIYDERRQLVETALKENKTNLECMQKAIPEKLKGIKEFLDWYLDYAFIYGCKLSICMEHWNNENIVCVLPEEESQSSDLTSFTLNKPGFDAEFFSNGVRISYLKGNGFDIKSYGEPCLSLKKQYKAVDNYLKYLKKNNENIIACIDDKIEKYVEHCRDRDLKISQSHYDI